MASIFPEKMMSQPTLTLEVIIGKLFYFHTQAHLFHFQTSSYSEHKALDNLYKELVEFKDTIGEQAMGYFKSRPRNLPTYPFENYSPECLQRLLDEIEGFSCGLMKFADSMQYVNLSNLAQELSGLSAKTRYLLTLK